MSDERRRKRYDTTGNTSESLDLENDDFDWLSFFRAQYTEITSTKIDSFKDKYQGSEEERSDVLAAYQKAQGNWRKLYDRVMLSNPVDDEPRFKSWIDEAIEAGQVQAYDAYANESEVSKKKRMTAAKREAKEAEEHSQKMQGKGQRRGKAAANGEGDLAAMIQQRQQSRAGNFLDDLEAKYAAPQSNGMSKKATSKKRKTDEPPEESFQKTAERAAKKRRAAAVDEEEEADGDDDVVDLEEDSEGVDEEEEEEDVRPVKRKRGSRAGKKKGRKSMRSKSDPFSRPASGKQ